jgi:hypothetical protein
MLLQCGWAKVIDGKTKIPDRASHWPHSAASPPNHQAHSRRNSKVPQPRSNALSRNLKPETSHLQPATCNLQLSTLNWDRRPASRSDEPPAAVALRPTGPHWPRTLASRQQRLAPNLPEGPCSASVPLQLRGGTATGMRASIGLHLAGMPEPLPRSSQRARLPDGLSSPAAVLRYDWRLTPKTAAEQRTQTGRVKAVNQDLT